MHGLPGLKPYWLGDFKLLAVHNSYSFLCNILLNIFTGKGTKDFSKIFQDFSKTF